MMINGMGVTCPSSGTTAVLASLQTGGENKMSSSNYGVRWWSTDGVRDDLGWTRTMQVLGGGWTHGRT